ncbi:hypothetical protein ET989_14600 [Propioniciclava sinopodophylli]|uniref:Uncharacterized protein n=1 Tax=Propioniciclava sinopodophylli TaxID=1837344 RepID=A0A4Q9KBW8_9ACTN|nr:hypothetical protein [Propioniciclava sinopodophylli]TBT82460.1 hypothetical protein ET989_14600 [Propioniciclava sinopodophylli]
MEHVYDILRNPGGLAVTVSFGSFPDQPPEVVAELDLWIDVLDEEAWVNAVLDLAREVNPETQTYDITVTKNYINWGADGGGAAILLYLGGRAFDLLADKAAGKLLRHSMQRLSGGRGHAVQSLEDAKRTAPYRVAMRYAENVGDLRLRGEGDLQDLEGWLVKLTGKLADYTVEVYRSGMVLITAEFLEPSAARSMRISEPKTS